MIVRTHPVGSIWSDDSGPLAVGSSGGASEAHAVSAPLIVVSQCSTTTAQPVAAGIPSPRGVLMDESELALFDASGFPVPLQTTPLAWWPDGSVKWLLLDFIVGPVVAGRSDWFLVLRGDQAVERIRPETPLPVVETEQGIVVETGAARFTLDRDLLAPIVQAEVDGAPILDASRSQTMLIDVQGRSRGARIERSEIEARGPVRATVRFDGTFDGRRDRLRFRARLSFFAGLALVRVDLTLHNPRRARHRGGLWDLGDPGSIMFRDLSLQLGLGQSGPRRICWTEELAGPARTTEAEPFEIYQDSSGGAKWQSRNHVNRFGQRPCRFRGYRVRQGGSSSLGLRASPVVSIQGPTGTITAVIPEFWQQFPKAIDTEGGTLSVRLFPGQFGDSFELQGGEQKTHTVWLQFCRSDRSETDSLQWVHRPARVGPPPEWYGSTGVIPHVSREPAEPRDRYDSFIAAVVDGPRSFSARRELIDEYGWRNYGEVYADHEGAYSQGDAPIISHYNNQYDVLQGLLTQYFRTGDVRWLDLADPLARHVIDIDIYHTTDDKAAYNGGLFWHTDHYRDAVTATHRTYSRANCGPVRRAYGGGPGNEHNYTTGLAYYYYLTGSPQARDAILSLADWVVAMDDGYQTVFGLIDDGPTGLASQTAQADYHGPGRGCGNSINALLDGWLVTQSRDYLDQAESLIRRAVHPEMDIAALDLLETELRWSYTVFLSVLGRYLSLKIEAGELDAMCAYARNCLLTFTAWMVEHEIPYFDRPEELEYPTETWAAQEFRKANVLRLAAQHAHEPLRGRLVNRGDELSERAWSDLLGFESRDVVRAVALLMVEGARDSYWRRHPIGCEPSPHGEFDFGSPQAFLPQKRRVLEQLKTPRGALRASLRLASARRWWQFLSRRGNSNL